MNIEQFFKHIVDEKLNSINTQEESKKLLDIYQLTINSYEVGVVINYLYEINHYEVYLYMIKGTIVKSGLFYKTFSDEDKAFSYFSSVKKSISENDLSSIIKNFN